MNLVKSNHSANSAKSVTSLTSRRSSNNKADNVYNAQIRTLDYGESGRIRQENFINQVFKKHYNVEIEKFYPKLLSIESFNTTDSGINSGINSGNKSTIKAVAGVRCAADEVLFSEYYLAQDLEDELSSIFGKKMERQKIVEVGNLAPANVGQMRWLIASITAYLYSAGFEYIVFTAVPGVYNAFKRMGIPLTVMAEAKQECLPDAIKQSWGEEYYAHKPMVYAGDIAQCFDIMKKNVYSTNTKLIPLFEKACVLGRQSMLKGDAA